MEMLIDINQWVQRKTIIQSLVQRRSSIREWKKVQLGMHDDGRSLEELLYVNSDQEEVGTLSHCLIILWRR